MESKYSVYELQRIIKDLLEVRLDLVDEGFWSIAESVKAAIEVIEEELKRRESAK